MSRTGVFWITMNPADITKARQFIDALRGDSTIDVLGLTRSMEVVSDLLFPATSTLHKRIRYQIFVPATFLSMYHCRQSFEPEAELLRLEHLLQQALLASGVKHNVFGSSRGEALKYWPSMIYWASLNALGMWGDESLGRLEALELIKGRLTRSPDSEEDHDARDIVAVDGLSDICRQIFPHGRRVTSLGHITFDLTKDEARFLRNRFLTVFPDSLTSYVLRNGIEDNCSSSAGYELFRFRCPDKPKLDKLIKQAEIYSRVAMGATYAYRWALCSALEPGGRVSQGSADRNAEHFHQWRERNGKRAASWGFKDLVDAINAFGGSFSDPRVDKYLARFLSKALSDGTAKQVLSRVGGHMREWEETIKGRNRSRFNNAELQISRNTLGEDEYSDFLFDYRWGQGSGNLRDLFVGSRRR